MSQTSETTLTASLMDELTAILATPDPEPAESWAYKIGNLPFGMVMGQLKSIGQIHDLLVTLPDGCFLIVLKENSPGVFTQAFRTGNSFQTECSVPNAWGNLIHRYRLPGGGDLPLALSQQVMAAYVQSEGSLPEITGIKHVAEPY